MLPRSHQKLLALVSHHLCLASGWLHFIGRQPEVLARVQRQVAQILSQQHLDIVMAFELDPHVPIPIDLDDRAPQAPLQVGDGLPHNDRIALSERAGAGCLGWPHNRRLRRVGPFLPQVRWSQLVRHRLPLAAEDAPGQRPCETSPCHLLIATGQALQLDAPQVQVLLYAGTVRSANRDVVDPLQGLPSLFISPKTLQCASSSEPRLVVLVVHPEGGVRRVQGLRPIAQLDRCLRDVLQNCDVQIRNHLVTSLVIVREFVSFHVTVGQPPTRQRLFYISIVPLDVPILSALLSHVQDLGHGVCVADNPLSLFSFFLLPLPVLNAPPHCFGVHLQHLGCGSIAAVVDLLPDALQILELRWVL
mmetsp:Transcript_117125/g.326298  ORF Transcript_117125/g.326298 Transcript_117125/m.326298 type:complete len:361 (-) Transcript_117125:787-1869(-)